MKFLYNLNIEWNSFFRISIALYSIVSLFSFWEDIPSVLLQNVPFSDLGANSHNSVLASLHESLTEYGYTTLFDDFVYFVIYIYLFMLGLLFLGAFTQIAALIAFLFNLIITASINPDFYEANYFATLALFFCVLFPRGKFSMDYHIKEFEINKISLKWSLYLLQTHLCIIYFFSGINKSIDIDWKAALANNSNEPILFLGFNLPDFTTSGIGFFILIIEVLYPIFINYSKTRKLWLAFTILMHVFMIVFARQYFFGILMTILNISAYYLPFIPAKKVDPDLDEESEKQLAYE